MTNKTIFTHDCLISGHYKRRSRFEWSDFFVSVILDEVLMSALSHRVGQLRLLACDAAHVCAVMMNGCLVCWFYGVSVVRFTVAGGLAEWDVSWKGANRGDVQLPVVTLSASHSAHLRT